MIKVFDMTAATTGINEQTAKREGIDYRAWIREALCARSSYPCGMEKEE